ncbi:MAG TPA: hypothetical protein VMF09_09430 [Solirubrobacteraceae bacterium]|nr:hypothetical protein [Solirubrobacteraceae bacterium]
MFFTERRQTLDMRNHNTQHLLRPSRLADRFVREPDWPLREAGSSLAHHSFSALVVLASLLALAFAVLLLVGVRRVWGRRRLAAEGRWFGVRFGEQVSRAAVESLMSTLAGGLPRPLLRPAPWVTLTLSSTEDRAACGLFVSGGVPVAQVRAAVEQGLGGVTVDAIGHAARRGGCVLAGICNRALCCVRCERSADCFLS